MPHNLWSVLFSPRKKLQRKTSKSRRTSSWLRGSIAWELSKARKKIRSKLRIADTCGLCLVGSLSRPCAQLVTALSFDAVGNTDCIFTYFLVIFVVFGDNKTERLKCHIKTPD